MRLLVSCLLVCSVYSSSADVCTNKCTKPHEYCQINAVGADDPFECACDYGYAYGQGANEGKCIPHLCHGKCKGKNIHCDENEVKYWCECNVGYKFADASKTDCIKDDVCKGKCTTGSETCVPDAGVAGGYRCQCYPAHLRNKKTKICEQDTRCKDRCTAGQMICLIDEKEDEGYRCQCWTGYRWKDSTKKRCVGEACHNKCTGEGQECMANRNIAAGYECDCKKNYEWNSGKTTCVKTPDKVDGKWTQWDSWSACSTTCGAGEKLRIRSCLNPSPAHGGKKCSGKSRMVKYCENRACPVDVNGGWTKWASWTTCSSKYGRGRQTRRRSCTNPRRQNGGSDCRGSSYGTKYCYGKTKAAAKKLCAKVYEHSRFRGRFRSIYASESYIAGGFNDKVSSIRVYNNCKLSVYRNYRYGGRHQTFGQGSYDIGRLSYVGNDQISSLKVNFPTSVTVRAAPRKLCAKLYQHHHFLGRVQSIYNSQSYLTGGFNNLVSSIRVYNHCKLTVYTNSRYGGRHQTLYQGNYDLKRLSVGNDKISSVKVYFGGAVTRASQAVKTSITNLDQYVGKRFYIRHKSDGKVMDVSGRRFRNNANLIWYKKHGGSNQQFTLKKRRNGYYSIHCYTSQKYVVDLHGHNRYNVIIYGYHGGANQLVKLSDSRDGYFKLSFALDKTRSKAIGSTGSVHYSTKKANKNDQWLQFVLL